MNSRWLRKRTIFILLVNCFSRIRGKMEGFVVGGDYVQIDQYPHSALLQISCYSGYTSAAYRCGSSIINQHFTLTAAHCVYDCNIERSHIAVVVGHENSRKGLRSSAKSFKIHEYYEHPAKQSDIALVQLKTPFGLNSKVKRVALIKPGHIPVGKVDGYVAGWGFIDDVNEIKTDRLKQVKQPVWSRENCTKFLGKLSKGFICAGYKTGNEYAAPGDSGSALIIRNYIQIGLVSSKNLSKSKSIIIYTDVGYFYDWIQSHTKRMFCKNSYLLHNGHKDTDLDYL